MKNRIKLVLAWLLFLPAMLVFVVLIFPMYIISGIDVFVWIENYVNYLCGESQDLNLNKKI